MHHLNKVSSRILGTIFFLSGMAALIYQVAWQRLLSIYYGVGPISTAIIVSLFMLGLGVGALLGGKLSGTARRPVMMYVQVELGIGIFGAVSFHVLNTIGEVTAGSDYIWMLLWVSLFLLVPTILMGMTLPIVIRVLHAINGDSLKNTSFFYFVNTLGAAFGALFCSYVLISLFGIDVAILAAVSVNIALALVILFLSYQYGSNEIGDVVPSVGSNVCSNGASPLIKIILLFANGFMAIGYQIVWYRIAGVVLKDSAYSFSSILSVYLVGVGLGSYWLNNAKSGKCVVTNSYDTYLKWNIYIGLSAICAVLVTYYLSTIWPISKILNIGHAFDILPHVDSIDQLGPIPSWLPTQLLVFFWPTVLMLVPTFFMGAAFPLGLTLLEDKKVHPSVTAGRAYAITILGNTLGGLVTSFLLLPTFGTMPVMAGFASLQVLYVLIRKVRGGGSLGVSAALCIVLLMLLMAPASKSYYMALLPQHKGFASYFQEGVEGVVMTYVKDDVVLNYINGSAHGGRPGYRFLNEAFVTLSHSDSPKRVLIIGYGTGSLTEAVLMDSRVERVTLVELNQTLVDNVKKVPILSAPLASHKIEVIVDDGRRFLQRTNERYDVILMNPLRTRSAYSNNIYSTEFFRLVKKHLNDNGVYLVWTDDKSYRLDRGVAEVFDYISRYDYFLVASMNGSSSREAIYIDLTENIADRSVRNRVRTLYPTSVASRQEVLERSGAKEAATDIKPYMEYYIHGLFLHN